MVKVESKIINTFKINFYTRFSHFRNKYYGQVKYIVKKKNL